MPVIKIPVSLLDGNYHDYYAVMYKDVTEAGTPTWPALIAHLKKKNLR